MNCDICVIFFPFSADDACKWCCKPSHNSTCEPYLENGLSTNQREGMPCFYGFCNKQVSIGCVEQINANIWRDSQAIVCINGFVSEETTYLLIYHVFDVEKFIF